MALHLVYRSSGKENAKVRPSFYGKALALASFVRAARQCGDVGHVVFLNDAPVDAGVLAMMSRTGEVVNHDGLTLPRSYREAVSIPVKRRWPASDVVYISEDDYLFRPEAFTSLVDASRVAPEASYFAFYATLPQGPPAPSTQGWQPAESTTSSFGARIETLAGDRPLHLAGSRAEDAFDLAISRAFRGRRPYTWRQVASASGGAKARARLARISSRAALNAGAAYRARHRPRVLLTKVPSLATHMEEAHLAEGVDWAEIAAETARWAAERGLSVESTSPSSP